MKFVPYSEKLKDPKWQKRRLKVMEYAHWRCQICGVSDKTLHCHHSYYTKGKEPWQYPDGSIICICDGCHAKIHDKPKPAPVHHPEPMGIKQLMQSQPVPAAFPPIPEREAVSRFAAMRAALECTPPPVDMNAPAPKGRFDELRRMISAMPDL